MTGILLSALSFGSLLSGLVLGSATRTWTLTTQAPLGRNRPGAASPRSP